MTPEDIEANLKARDCSIIEHAGDFALVYSFGYNGRKRAHDLLSKVRANALAEAWAWLHPELRVAERIEIIKRIVAQEFGLSIEQLCGASRPESIATPRRIAMALALTITNASTYMVGATFGGRDHGTALYAKKSLESECEVNLELGARIGALRQQCLLAFERAKL